VDPRAGLDGRKISSPTGFDPGSSSPSSVAVPTELPSPHLLTVIYKYIKIYSLTQLSVRQLLLKIFHTVSHSLTGSCVRLYILYCIYVFI